MCTQDNRTYQQMIIKILVKEFLNKTEESVNNVIAELKNKKLLIPEDMVKDKLLRYYLEKFFKLDRDQLPLCIVFENVTYSPEYPNGDKLFMHYPLMDNESQKNKEVSMLILSILVLLIDFPIVFMEVTNRQGIQDSIKDKARKNKFGTNNILESYRKMLGEDKKLDQKISSRIYNDFNYGYSSNAKINESYYLECDSDNILNTHSDSNFYKYGTTITMKIALVLDIR